MKANILNVQRFCTRDGPGIRTTVFFKGCPLHCLWCHNPETLSPRRQLLYNAERCLHCLRCTALCPRGAHKNEMGRHLFDRDACAACGACLSPTCQALELAGEERDTDALLAEILKDLPFYRNSGGGLTLSGGEPLLQWQACRALLEGARAHGIHTAVETSGAVARVAFEQTLAAVDLYLFDVKETDPARHQAFTGADNRQILENLRYLDRMGKQIVLRCPIIPGLNDRADHAAGIAALAGELSHVAEIVIEPYHTLGVGKYGRLGLPYTLTSTPPLDTDAAQAFVKTLQASTDTPVRLA